MRMLAPPPGGGTLAIVPSAIVQTVPAGRLHRTRRVIDGFFRLFDNLVDLVDINDACWARINVAVRGPTGGGLVSG